MEIESKITEKIIKKTIMITLETPEEVDTFKNMMKSISSSRCTGNRVLIDQLRDNIRKELEK